MTQLVWIKFSWYVTVETQNTKLLNTLTRMSRWQWHVLVWWLCTNLLVVASTFLSWKWKPRIPSKRWCEIAWFLIPEDLTLITAWEYHVTSNIYGQLIDNLNYFTKKKERYMLYLRSRPKLFPSGRWYFGIPWEYVSPVLRDNRKCVTRDQCRDLHVSGSVSGGRCVMWKCWTGTIERPEDITCDVGWPDVVTSAGLVSTSKVQSYRFLSTGLT
jgi:hypothetical protein